MKNNKVNVVCMAFAAGKVSAEVASIKRYTGVAPVFVKAVNPSKKELEAIYNTEIENDPVYVGEVEVGDDHHKVANVRLDFIVSTDPDHSNGIEMTTKVALFLRNEYRFNRDQTKVQVIDKYGRTAWVTKEQLANHEIPVYSNGPANLDPDYRPCFVGEEELTNFLISYLNIPSPMRFNRDERKWYMVENPEDSEARLENVANYFKGDFSELKEIIALQPNNKVKVLFGVRNTDDNRQFQSVYTHMFLKNNVRDYSRLAKDVEDRKSAGSYSNTEFTVGDLKEYKVEATDFSKAANVQMPGEVGDMPDFTGMDTPWPTM